MAVHAASSSCSASQPAGPPKHGEIEDGTEHHCAIFSLVSFNFGMDQNMIHSKRTGPEHSAQLSRLFDFFALGASADFIFGCELGSFREGFDKQGRQFGMVVHGACPRAQCQNSGAYGSIWDIQGNGIELADEGTWVVTGINRPVDLFWQAFTMKYKSESSGQTTTVGLLVGNLHILCGKNPPSVHLRRQIVHACLNYLATKTILD